MTIIRIWMNRLLFATRVLGFCLLVSGAAHGATKIDPSIDYFAVLGINQDTFTDQDVMTAFRKTVRESHPNSPERRASAITDMDLIVTAKDILSNPALRQEWRSMRETWLATQTRKAGSGNGPKHRNGRDADEFDVNNFNANSESTVGQDGDFFRGFRPGNIYSAARASIKPVEYYRQHPEAIWTKDYHYTPDNNDASLKQQVAKAQQVISQAWVEWLTQFRAAATDANLVLEKFEEIAATKDRSHPALVLASDNQVFLWWWFQQPESLLFEDVVFNTLKQLQPGSGLYRSLMRASISNAHWRTRAWINRLLPLPESYFAVGPAVGTPELATEVDIIQQLVETSEYRQGYAHSLWSSILETHASIENADEWIKPYIESDASASLFLTIGGMRPIWIQTNPQVITKALKVLCRNRVGSREAIFQQLLSYPESAAHPEWLQLAIMTDENDLLLNKLNQILAQDHWYNHPYLRHILGGRAPTVEGLRRARWVTMHEALPKPTQSQQNHLPGHEPRERAALARSSPAFSLLGFWGMGLPRPSSQNTAVSCKDVFQSGR